MRHLSGGVWSIRAAIFSFLPRTFIASISKQRDFSIGPLRVIVELLGGIDRSNVIQGFRYKTAVMT